MLNPEFRLLDPDAEHIERLAACSEMPEEEQPAWEEGFLSAAAGTQAAYLERLTAGLAEPGSHTEREIAGVMQTLAAETGIAPLETFTFGWPDSLLAEAAALSPEPAVLMLALLDGEGIWAGVIAGVSRGGLDFLATFDWLWADEPELAVRQSLTDLPDLCRAAQLRFARPTGGLFIYRDEFLAWRDSGWSPEVLAEQTAQGTAAWIRP